VVGLPNRNVVLEVLRRRRDVAEQAVSATLDEERCLSR
jgi:hypothetical protein